MGEGGTGGAKPAIFGERLLLPAAAVFAKSAAKIAPIPLFRTLF